LLKKPEFFAAPLSLSLQNQGCFKAWSADNRWYGSF